MFWPKFQMKCAKSVLNHIIKYLKSVISSWKIKKHPIDFKSLGCFKLATTLCSSFILLERYSWQQFEECKSTNGKVRYRVEVRMRGYAPVSHYFDRKTDAKLWAQMTETDMREGRYFKTAEAKKHTIGELIDRYIATVLPQKRKSEKKTKSPIAVVESPNRTNYTR